MAAWDPFVYLGMTPLKRSM